MQVSGPGVAHAQNVSRECALDARLRQYDNIDMRMTASTFTAARPRWHSAAIAVTLLILGLVPRMVNLGNLSFYADEETSAMPARALLEGSGPVFPSGMEYRRALPLTYVMALSASVVGADEELAYRLPAALLGALTVVFLFLFGRTFTGDGVAVVAALLLALSEWHLVYSRQARMYAVLVLLVFVAGWGLYRWILEKNAKAALIGLAGYSMAVLVHLFAVFAIIIPLAATMIPGMRQVRPWRILVLAAAGVLLALWVNEGWVGVPFRNAVANGERYPALTGGVLAESGSLPVVLQVVGLAIALFAGSGPLSDMYAKCTTVLARLGVLTLGVGSLVLVGIGQLYGSLLTVLALLILSDTPTPSALSKRWLHLSILGILAVFWLGFAVVANGLTLAALRLLSSAPHPHLYYIAQQFPALILLFVTTCLVFAISSPTAVTTGARVCAATVLISHILIGLSTAAEATRYYLHLYPLILLVAAYGMVAVGRVALRRGPAWAAPLLACVLVFTGAIGGHGVGLAVNVVTLRHGEAVNSRVHIFPFRPDHRGPGQFVRERLRPDDVVIAEDVLQQQWYAGRADWFLRNPADIRAFLRPAGHHVWEEIYVEAKILDDVNLARLLDTQLSRVWIITSGEVHNMREWYLTERQRVWLDGIERSRQALFVGSDGVSSVYCIGCKGLPDDPQ